MQKTLVIDALKNFAPIFHYAKAEEATDIYILEGRMPRVGRLKEYFPVKDFDEPTSAEIEDFILNTLPDDPSIIKNTDIGGFQSAEYAFAVKDFGRFRVSATTSEEGVGVSIRKLPFFIPLIKTLDPLNFLRGLKPIYEGKIKSGLVIHTGITGSGKSTLMASGVDLLAQSITGNIFTFENPIEYQYGRTTRALVRQYEVGRHFPSYMDALKFSLRNNPSAILLGEVRTHEEIMAMVDIAMRGHVVFSTLHTSDVMNTIRFIDSISEEQKETWRQLLAYSLKAVVSQKLIYKKDRGFILVPEVFIPNSVAKTKIADGDYKDLRSMFFEHSMRENGCFTFEDTFKVLQREGVLSDAETKNLMEENLRF